MKQYQKQIKWLAELSGKEPIVSTNVTYVEFIPSKWSKRHMGVRVELKPTVKHPKIIYLDAHGHPNGYWDFSHYESAGTKQLVKEVVNEAHIEAFGTPKFEELG